MARLDSFIETFQCRDCIKQVVKEYKIVVKSGSTPGKEKASKPEEQPQTSKPEEQPQTSKPEEQPQTSKPEQQTSKSEEPIGDISGIEVNESEEDKTTLDDVEHFESNTDALVCLGETRYGIKMKSADLARCEEQSQTAEKFVLNLLEYLVTKSDCQAMTVYGHGKNKREMDPQMRKAIK
ncbi:uncharacterized protein LOC127732489, partial [Mytilus californianus]|uniref:uncharacterized protein LOC127732489 n=1 Tax=Mytilus californianus TaxID=6549 RepID=UPI00224871BE